MARYIDAEKLIEHLKDNIEECETPNVVNEPVAYGTVLGLECALSYAETLPTADVVEVVFCKDCKHRETPCCPMRYIENIDWDDDGYTERDSILHDSTADNAFCSYGERRANNDDE